MMKFQPLFALDPDLFGQDQQVVKSGETAWTFSSQNDTSTTFRFVLALVKNPETSRGNNFYAYALPTNEDEKPAAKRAKQLLDGDDETCSKTVARIQGTLLHRGYHGFFQDADAVSSELQATARAFFDATGTNCRIQHEALKKLGKGGLLFIDEIETALPGMDLGLHLLHAVLAFCKDDFALAVIDLAPLNPPWCKYERNIHRATEADKLARRDKVQGANNRKAAVEKIQRHFARMGFQQAVETKHGWFVTNQDYFFFQWLSKQEAAKITIELTEAPTRSAIDQELHNAINDALLAAESASQKGVPDAVMRAVNCLAGRSMFAIPDGSVVRISKAVKDGASVDRAQGLHLAAGSWKTPSMFHLLTALGGDVNAADFSGNRRLHVAAAAGQVNAAKLLLELGADRTVRNRAGEQPVDLVNLMAQSMDDFAVAMGLQGNPMFEAKRAREDEGRQDIKSLLEP